MEKALIFLMRPLDSSVLSRCYGYLHSQYGSVLDRTGAGLYTSNGVMDSREGLFTMAISDGVHNHRQYGGGRG